MPDLRTYRIAVVFAVIFVLFSPLGLFTIFLSGDSCCGQNTTGTMLGVTAGLVVLLTLAAALVNGVVKLTLKRHVPDFTVRVATLITAAPAAVIHILFVLAVSATAF